MRLLTERPISSVLRCRAYVVVVVAYKMRLRRGT
jgi:hypothetical protein